VIIHCLAFGDLWWLRPGQNPDSSLRFTSDAAVFNTTGFVSGARERRNWIVPGVIRFNAGTCQEQRLRPEKTAQVRFASPGLEHRGTLNRLLLQRRVRFSVPADFILVCLSSLTHGHLHFDSEWRTSGVRLVAASEFGEMQQTMILIPPHGRIITTKGEWRCAWNDRKATLTQTG
jgi:hypothetical protein